MSRLWRYLARYRLRYAAGIVCLVLTQFLTNAIPFLSKWTIDAITRDEPFARFVALIVGIALVQAIVRTYSRFVIFNVGRDIEYDLRNDLFAHLERQPLAFYHVRQTGDLMSRLVNDVTAVRMLLGPGVLNFINTPIAYAVGLGIMLSIDPWLTLASIAVYPVALVIVKRTSRILIERTLRVQEGLGELSSRVQENLSGIQAVKAYAAEEQEIGAFSKLNDRFQDQSLRLARVRGFIVPVMQIVHSVSTLVVLWLGGQRVMAGTLSLGDLTAFMLYLYNLAWPTMALGWMLTIYQRGHAAMQRLNALFAIEPTIVSRPDAKPVEPFRGEITLRDVSFRFPGSRDGRRALDRVTFTIPAGKTVAIVGRTGAGKSALVQLLTRLFDVEEGTILLDGRDIRTLPLGWLRREVGLVPQDPFLFSRSLRENVTFGLDEEVPGRAEWAVRLAGLTRDLAEMPAGIETIVGERGITLSGGQKQRVALARTLATTPRVLVLDDALSAVDAATEREMLDGLRDFFRERTTVLVAHRVTTVKEADLIVVVDEGRVVEVGDHASLLAEGRAYAELFRQQALEGELEAI